MTPPQDIVYPENLEKTCTKCGVSKRIGDFWKADRGLYGRSSQCKACRSTKKPKIPTSHGYKICSNPTCKFLGFEQPIASFFKDKNYSDGMKSHCKSCCSEWQKEWLQKNKDKRLEKRRAFNRQKTKDNPGRFKGAYKPYKEKRGPEWAKMNITRITFAKFRVNQEWFDDKLSSQNGLCAICGKDKEHPTWKRFSIDHDHSCCGPKKACEKCRRGLLCHACNIKLGLIENEEWLINAFAYLKQYGKDFSDIINPLTTSHLPNSTVTAPS